MNGISVAASLWRLTVLIGAASLGDRLRRYVTNNQPRQALERWYLHYRTFEALPRMSYEHLVVERVRGAITARLEAFSLSSGDRI